jgi:FxsC-like protein
MSVAGTSASSDDTPGSDKEVLQFFDDLQRQVGRRAGTDAAGFLSLETADGSPGDARTANALARCKVFVPLYSRRYFNSEECGKELSAFMSRTAGLPASSPVPIVPVLWIPTPTSWPEVPEPPLHVDDPEVDDRYLSSGLYELMTMREYDQNADRGYHLLVDTLCDQIVGLGTRVPLRSDIRIHLGEARSAFAQKPARPLELHVLAPYKDHVPNGRDASQYGDSALQWRLYERRRDEDLARRMTKVARNLGYEPTLSAFDASSGRLLGTEPPTGPAVLVVDPWALDDDDWCQRLHRFDALAKPWVGVVVAWDLLDPQTAQNQDRLLALVNDTLPRRFRRRRIGLQLSAGVTATADEFGRALSAVVQESASRYLRHVMTRSRSNDQ